MKKIFIMLLSLGAVIGASAQYEHHGYDDRHPDVSVNIGAGRIHGDNFDRRIDEINREYDHRIWEVRNNYRLSPFEKRRIIHRLERERVYKIREARRWRERRMY
jgi:hypothetical protein